MNSGKYVFAQILSFVNRYEFRKCVVRYDGDHRVRRLNCWNQFAQLLFGQLTSRNGLRDICLCLGAHRSSLFHMGMKQKVEQSTLSRANENRDWRIFADFGAYLIVHVRPMYTDEPIPGIEIDNDVFALDSTTISVSLVLMEWAHGKYSRGAVKMHTLLDLRGSIPVFIHISDGRYHDVNALDLIEVVAGAVYVMDKAYIDFERLYEIHTAEAFFTLRAKKNLSFRAVSSRKVDKSTGLRCDQTIRLSGPKSKKLYPQKLRRVKYRDAEKGITLVFLTNNFEMGAMDIAAVYKNRWQIEVFFRWIKQNLEVKKLWGHSENAVKTHLWVAICSYLILASIKHQLRSEYSIYEMAQILGTSAFAKKSIDQLFTKKQINQNFKEQLNLFSDNDL